MEDNMIKVYELDFGDTNLIDDNIESILAWIETDMNDMGDSGELTYTITSKLITKEEFTALPEWS